MQSAGEETLVNGFGETAAPPFALDLEAEPRELPLTFEMYERLWREGAFEPWGDRVQLIRGRVYLMTPSSDRHVISQSSVFKALLLAMHEAALLDTWRVLSGTIRNEHSGVEPDAFVRKADAPSRGEYLTAEGVVLSVEVAKSSRRLDLGVKRRLYAEMTIPEYWVVDLKKNLLHVFRQPDAGDYTVRQELTPDQTVSPLFAPELTLAVRDLF